MNTKPALVTDIMTVDPIFVFVDASVEEADALIRSTVYLTSVPVVDGKGVLVGVIHDADLAAYRFDHSQHPDETAARSEATSDAGPDRTTRH